LIAPLHAGGFRRIPFHHIADSEVAQEPKDMSAREFPSLSLDVLDEVRRCYLSGRRQKENPA